MHRGLFNSMDLDRDQNSADPTSSYSMQRAESNAADSATNSATSSSMQNESNAASCVSVFSLVLCLDWVFVFFFLLYLALSCRIKCM